MTNNYLVTLNDGVRFRTENIDLKTTLTFLNGRVIAVKLNNKAIQKQLITMVADAESKNDEGKNMCITLANETFYFLVDDVNSTIDGLINDINTNQWVDVAGGLIFNRNAFQYAEEYIKQV